MVARTTPPTTIPPATISVLIADDNEICVNILARVFSTKRFSKLAVFDITVVSSAEEALEHLNERRYDIIFSDNEMSGMSGIDMVKHIREKDRTTPIIAVTSKFDDESRTQYRKSGFTEWLQKPAKSNDIYSAVERLSMTSL
jgi:CheY-like chemotaxis protein